jgi:hypothetical protein
MRVRLTRKLAHRLNSVDLSRHAVGDVVDLPTPNAEMLIEEGWAVLADGAVNARPSRRSNAANHSGRRASKRR